MFKNQKFLILMPQVQTNSDRFPRFVRITWRFQRVNLTLASVIERFPGLLSAGELSWFLSSSFVFEAPCLLT